MAGRRGAAAQTSAATPIAAGRTVHRLKNPYLDDIAVSSNPGPNLGQRADSSNYSQCSKLQRCGYGARERRQRAFSMRVIRSELPAEAHAATREQDPALGRGSPSGRYKLPESFVGPGPCDGCYHEDRSHESGQAVLTDDRELAPADFGGYSSRMFYCLSVR